MRTCDLKLLMLSQEKSNGWFRTDLAAGYGCGVGTRLGITVPGTTGQTLLRTWSGLGVLLANPRMVASLPEFEAIPPSPSLKLCFTFFR